MTKRIIFDKPNLFPPEKGHSYKLEINFRVVDNSYVDKPEEQNMKTLYSLIVNISDLLAATWGNNWENKSAYYENLLKVLYELGKRKIIEEVKKGTLKTNDSLIVSELQNTCPYEPSNINLDKFILVEIPMGFKA